MAEYNNDTLQGFFDRRDFLGAADYLNTVKAATPQKQIILNRQIAQLRRDGEIQAAMLQKMTPEEQNAFHFISSLNSVGSIPHTVYDDNGRPRPGTANTFGDAYTQALNNITASNGTLLNRIGITLTGDGLLEDLYSSLDVQNDTQALDRYGIRVERDANTGNYNLSVSRDNKKLQEFLSAVHSTYADRVETQGRYNPTTGDYEVSPLAGNFSYFGTDDQGNTYSEGEINMSSIRATGAAYGQAKRLYESAMERLSAKTYDEEMYVTPFLGHGHANAYKRMRQGLISIDDYKKIVEERTNTYNTLLKQADLTQQQDVYVMDMADDESASLKKVDSVRAREINRILLVAMNKKAVTYSAAMHGGQVGTYITIDPVKEEDGSPVKELGHGYRIFVPGLFKSSCDEAFENDTQTAAARDLADMKHWNYGKHLSDGNYVGWDDNIGVYTYERDANGRQVKVQKSQEWALQQLNRENIIQKSAETLMANLDKDGNPLQQNVNGQLQPYDLENAAKTLAAVGVNELYPKGTYSDGQRLEAHNDIYNRIMEILNTVTRKQNDE